MRVTRTLAALAALMALAGCGDRAGDRAGKPAEATGEHPTIETLPAPEGTRGSVTGMPDRPGPGRVGVPEATGLPAGLPVSSQDNPDGTGDTGVDVDGDGLVDAPAADHPDGAEGEPAEIEPSAPAAAAEGPAGAPVEAALDPAEPPPNR